MAGHCHRRDASSIMQFVVLLLIATSAFPLICASSPASDSSDIDNSGHSISNNNNRHHAHNHHHRRHPNQHPPGTDHGEPQQQQPSDVSAGYSDSYITKEAAQELQERLRQLHHHVSDEEYNALLQRYISRPKSDPSHPMFGKVYYDYLKSEVGEEEQRPTAAVGQQQQQQQRKDEGEQVIDLTVYSKNKRKIPFKKMHHFHIAHGDRIEDVETQQQQQQHNQHHNHQGERRTKRSLSESESGHEIHKRQTGVWTNQYQRQATRRTYIAPPKVVAFSAAAATDHDYEDQPASAANAFSSRYKSPWTNHRHVAYDPYALHRPHDYYLPVAPPPEFTQFIVRPYQPWMSFPVPGVVYNPAFPPKNPPSGGSVTRPHVVRPTDTNSIAGGDKDAGNTNTNLGNRFGGNDDDDRFIFDVEDRTTPRPRPSFNQPQPPRRPPPPLIRDSDNADNSESAINSIFGINRQFNNQQRPAPTTQRPFSTRRPPPPLIRDSDNADNSDAAIENIFGNNRQFNNQQRPAQTTQRPFATRRPPPPLIRDSDNADNSDAAINNIFGTNNRPASGSSNQFGNTNTATGFPFFEPQRPQFTNPTRAPPARFPPTTTTTPAPDDGPSQCVWAIVNCCSPNNRQVRYSCFERFGCGGAFWDINPCNEDVFDSAVDIADKYVE